MKAVKNFNPAIDGARLTVNGMEFVVCTILTQNGVNRFLLMPKREHRKRIRWGMDWEANLMTVSLVTLATPQTRVSLHTPADPADERILLVQPIVREDFVTAGVFLNNVVHRGMDRIMSNEPINWN